MISQKKIKFSFIVTLGVIYFISFWLLTIGYFTPNWFFVDLPSFASEWTKDHNYNDYIVWHSCDRIGLVKPTYDCDAIVFDWFEENKSQNIGHIYKIALILMTTALAVVYTNAMMLGMAIVYDLFHYSFYTSLLSVSFGVLYPIAAVLILVATIYVEAFFTYHTGYSTILCTTAGCLMLFFYIGLILYDQAYIKYSLTSKGRVRKLYHGRSEWEVKGGNRGSVKLHSNALMTRNDRMRKI